ncbi:hypothetical protein GCM10028862_17230 [Luteimonas pelagia]
MNMQLGGPSSRYVALALGGLAALATATADAATVRRHQSTATEHCQPSTPLNLGGLRFRPFGIYNASANPIYIVCSLPMDSVSEHVTDAMATPATTGPALWIDFKSSSSVDVTVECVVASGNRFDGSNNVPYSIPIAAGQFNLFTATGLDRMHEWGNVNVNCLLPPKVEMGQMYIIEYDADDAL